MSVAEDATVEMPNAPSWIFDAAIADAEKTRLQDDIVAACKTVYDPEIPCDIYELGLIYKVAVNDSGFVDLDMTLTAPGCPVAGDIVESVQEALASVHGVSGNNVSLVFDPAWDQGRMSDEARVSLDMF